MSLPKESKEALVKLYSEMHTDLLRRSIERIEIDYETQPQILFKEEKLELLRNELNRRGLDEEATKLFK